jgi:hypothetical protein
MSGCATVALPDGDPSIRGTITSLTPGAGGEVTILVEAQGIPAFEYDKASVRVSTDTLVLEGTDGPPYIEATPDDLAVGQEVYVWFTGAVAESYPVQTSAGTVLIRN